MYAQRSSLQVLPIVWPVRALYTYSGSLSLPRIVPPMPYSSAYLGSFSQELEYARPSAIYIEVELQNCAGAQNGVKRAR
ncbi:hypothetical protein OE88DRAFT_1657104 [Heliocybe sulcata]|uniref:Uncharacterized protein n=1 Tax=Heliocybe sulcata TaxID=5364 RepID=A0A5C3N8N4_9AGAM|nr:hypothetical protein OE88DRAFT_1657104 [Heliocybe sulcata]